MMSQKKIFFFKNTNFNILNFLYYVYLIFLFIAISTMPLNSELLKKLTSNAFIYLNVLIFLSALNISTKKKDLYSLNLIFLVFLLLVLSIVFFNVISVNTIAIALGFLSSFLIVYYSEHITLTKNILKAITWICVLSSFVFIFNYFSPMAYRYIIEDEHGINQINHFSLTLGYPNPNTTASIIAPILMTLIILSKVYVNKYTKYTMLCLSLVLLYFLFLTDSRSAFFSVFLYISFVVLNIKIRITRSFVILVLISLFVFIFIYLLLFSNQIGLGWKILGKSFYSGRQGYLSDLFVSGFDSWLFGDISKYRYGNFLNGFLSIFLSGGIVSVILYILFFSHNISKRYDKNNDYSYTALLAIVLFYFQSFAEGNFMVSGGYFAGLMSMLYVLANIKVVSHMKINTIQ